MWLGLAVAGVISLTLIAVQSSNTGAGTVARTAQGPEVREIIRAAPDPASAPAPTLTATAVDSAALERERRLEIRLARIEDELSALRGDSSRAERLTGDLEHRIDLIEEAFGSVTGSVGSTAAPTPPASVRIPTPSQRPARVAQPADAPVAARAPTQLFRPAPTSPTILPAPLTTSSTGTRATEPIEPVEPTAPDELPFASPAPAPSPGPITPRVAFGVDLGGFGNLGDLKRYWAQLVGQNPLLLGGLVPRHVTRIGADGIRSYRLIAGPLDDVTSSARLCIALEARQIDCTQTMNGGETI